ncbi:hypothetical protein ASZ90_011080 [hydrocarbon metagenome]|uniref:DUF365 domain-containing protein n=1 Tax=hydrocarbon metagenome TaxID=938273 RepID=A0A0W8FEA5_9ZZZZ
MSGITGVTFPVPKKYMPRFFEEGKTVFVKPATVYKDLRRGMKLVFYQSHEDTGYVGEADIKRIIVADDPLTFLDTYGDAVFLTREELEAYLGDQERWQGVRVWKGEGKGEARGGAKKRPWLALELENIRRYPQAEKPDRFVPVGGRYLRE